jgi:hypothetical protein
VADLDFMSDSYCSLVLSFRPEGLKKGSLGCRSGETRSLVNDFDIRSMLCNLEPDWVIFLTMDRGVLRKKLRLSVLELVVLELKLSCVNISASDKNSGLLDSEVTKFRLIR